MEECIAYLASMVKKLQDEKEKSSSRLDGKQKSSYRTEPQIKRPPKRPVTGAQRVKTNMQDQDAKMLRNPKTPKEEVLISKMLKT